MTKLEKIGVAYISRTGKSLLLKITDDPRTTFTYYLCIHRGTLEEVLGDKKAEAAVSLVKA